MLRKIFILIIGFYLFYPNVIASAMPLIEDKAPDFKTDSTQGKIIFPKDYKGKWVILFSHPGDFTPVCTTEFIEFQNELKKFDALNTKLIGLSIDDVNTHRKWIDSIKQITQNTNQEVNIIFPIIDDKNGEIAKKYGMLHDNKEKTIRAVFVIDPQNIVKAIIYYPQNVGRSIPEIQRLLIALQTADNFNVATPANWIPGDDVVIPTQNLPDEIQEDDLKELNIKKHSAYLYTQNLPKEKISEKLINSSKN